jgi:HYR domain
MKTLTALLIVAVALPLGANAAADRSSGTLDVNSTLGSAYRFGRQYCPPGTPSTTVDCVQFSGAVSIPGLGRAIVSYVKSFDPTICPDQVTQQKTTLIDVAGKGQIKIAMNQPVCADPAPSSVVIGGTIAEGTGIYAGASGSVQVASTVNAASCGPGGCTGSSNDTWTGNLVVPGREFDLTPPVFQTLATKQVKAPRKAKRVRVRYAPQAQDAVDGPMSVTCKPASGSRFKVGRTTRVSCSAEDTSANVATTSFRVKVARRR